MKSVRLLQSERLPARFSHRNQLWFRWSGNYSKMPSNNEHINYNNFVSKPPQAIAKPLVANLKNDPEF